jgi:hypothetical protein
MAAAAAAAGLSTWLQWVEPTGQPSAETPLAEVLTLIQSGEIHDETLVWTEGMSGWCALKDVMTSFAWPAAKKQVAAAAAATTHAAAAGGGGEQQQQQQQQAAEAGWSETEEVALAARVEELGAVSWAELDDEALLETLDLVRAAPVVVAATHARTCARARAVPRCTCRGRDGSVTGLLPRTSVPYARRGGAGGALGGGLRVRPSSYRHSHRRCGRRRRRRRCAGGGDELVRAAARGVGCAGGRGPAGDPGPAARARGGAG